MIRIRIDLCTTSSDHMFEDRDQLVRDICNEVNEYAPETSVNTLSPQVGEFAVADPSSISLLIHAVQSDPTAAAGVGTAVAAITAIGKVALKWVETRSKPLRLKVGAVSIDLPPNTSPSELERLVKELLPHVTAAPKLKKPKKK